MPIVLGTPVRENSHILLSISIGYETQTKENFKEMAVAIIEETRIRKVTIFKADWIQHHHIQIKQDISQAIAIQEAENLSLQWDRDNVEAIQAIHIAKGIENVEVRSWLDFVTTDDYARGLIEFQAFKETDKRFSDLCDGMVGFIVNTLYKKHYESASPEKKRHIRQSMLHFMFGDCIFMKIALSDPSLPYDYELYRGHRNSVIKYLYNKEKKQDKLKEIPLLSREIKSPKNTTITKTLVHIEQALNRFSNDEQQLTYACECLLDELNRVSDELKVKTPSMLKKIVEPVL